MRIRASLSIFLFLLGVLSAGAQSAEKLFEAGRKAFQDGMYVMAARNFRELTDQYPDSPLADDAEYLDGVANFYLGEFQSCISALKNYARKYPRSANNRRVSYWLGSAYFQLLDYEHSRFHLQNQVDEYPDEQPYFDHALLLKAMVEENLSDWASARRSYSRVLDRQSARDLWPESLYRSGGIDMRSGKYSEALTAFSRILVEFPDSPYADESVFFLGECAFFLGRYAEAEGSFRSVLASDPPPEQRETSLYRLALILSELKQSQEALGFCRELELRFPRSPYIEPLARLQADLLFDLKRYNEAYDAYAKALEAGGGAEEQQVIYYNMGLSAYLGGDLPRSVEPLSKALQGSARIAEQSLFRLAAVEAELGLVQEAAGHFEQFRRRFPSSPSREEATRILAALYTQKGYTQRGYTQGGRQDNAEGLYTELITRYPDSAYQDEYLFKRGSSYLQSGTVAAALKDFYALIERWPDSPYAAESTYNLGYIYSQRGEYKRGIPYFEDVLEAGPSAELAGRAILAAGVCAFNMGDYAAAVRWFRRNTTGGRSGTSPWVGESWFYLGRTYYKIEQLEEAADSFAKAAAVLGGSARAAGTGSAGEDSQGEEALFWQGLSEFRLERFETAKQTFLALTARHPGGQRVAESYYRAGVCAAQVNGYAESIEYYDRALQALGSATAQLQTKEYRDNLHQEILYQKGLSHLSEGQRDRAVQTYESLSREFPKSTLASEAFFKIAEEDFRIGDYAAAAAGFLRLTERFPDTPAAASALYWAGLSSARGGERAAALEYLIGYLEDGSGAVDGSSGALADLAMQEIRSILSQIGGPDRAEEGRVFEDFYRRVDRSPSLQPRFKNRVRLEYARYIFSDRPEAAMAILQSVRAEDPEEPLASEVNYLIGEYYRVKGELGRAYDIFSGIIGANSERPGAAAQLGIGRVLEARGQNQEAAEEYLKVHFLYPDQTDLASEGLYRAGLMYWNEGYRERAGELFERLAGEYPDSPWLDQVP